MTKQTPLTLLGKCGLIYFNKALLMKIDIFL